ncbi:MAG: Zn-dependent M16 (insulinase) family peptidase [Gammaproteobacteria bacterium]|jgi:Zn-dependent M16 (insulinase) family peptidase
MSVASFVLVRETPVPSLNLTFQEYRHERTGARHFHLASEDTNNAFLVAFLTVPQDSTGVAHILEHTSLCGSRRFPVRDPFFMMIRRSLNTFMNAFTAPDWTAYPFASQNKKDFDNLLEVYLDAAFFPLLDPLDFAQEGHRMEFSEPGKNDSPLEFKGVVYNEMKGAMSAPVSQVGQVLQSELFPSTTYHHNSGGDPEKIPDLTHGDLTAFHARHYHPSNAVFMTYGNFPVEGHHQRIDDLALRHFDRQPVSLGIEDETRFSAPREVTGVFATDDEDLEHKSHAVIGWLLGKSTDAHESMRARLLAGVLLDNSASPLRRALETTALGTAPSELCGLDDSLRETTFVAGLEGCSPEDAPAIEALILSTLQDIADNGVDNDVVDAVVHQVELAQREISGGGFPYGLQLMVRSLSPALYGADPYESLDIDPILDDVRKETGDKNFIPNLVRELLLDNPHRIRLTMSPDPKAASEQAAREFARLESARAALDAQACIDLQAQADALLARQSADDDPELLPKVGIEDIPATVALVEPSARNETPYRTTLYTPGTNGLVYVQLVAELPNLDAELAPLLPLFCDFFADLGCGHSSYLEIQARQAAVSGGVRARTSMRSRADTLTAPRAFFVLAGKALSRNQSALIELLRDTYHNVRFDELDRLRELIAQARLHGESQVTDSGHALAMLAATSGMSPCAALEHQWGGLAGLRTLKELDEAVANPAALASLAAKLARIHNELMKSACETLLVCEPAVATSLNQAMAEHWSDLERHASAPTGDGLDTLTNHFQSTVVNQAWTTNTQVNFCARAFAAPPQAHQDAAALRVLGGFLRNTYLHRAIREQGGAYGGGAGYSSDSGSFRFFSYRDPRAQATLDDFDASVRWLLDNAPPARQLEEAILGVIGEIDRPDSPAGEAVIAYFGALHGRTPEQRRHSREAVLDVTMDDLRRVTQTYLSGGPASTVIVTSTGTLDAESSLGYLDRHQV